MEIVVGQIVISKQGRDKGLPFIVMATEEGYVHLADGKLRKMENPKKKKLMHIAKTNHIVTAKLEKDSDLRKAIENFTRKGD